MTAGSLLFLATLAVAMLGSAIFVGFIQLSH
jgi:hypothetical protein